jgi:hypothetical protein
MEIRDKDSSRCSTRSREVGEILKAKQKEYEKATDREDIERLVPEIEMLKFVLFLVCRDDNKKER